MLVRAVVRPCTRRVGGSSVPQRSNRIARQASTQAGTVQAPIFNFNAPEVVPQPPKTKRPSKPRDELSQAEIDELVRLRHEDPGRWSKKKLSMRYNVPVAVVARTAPDVRYIKQELLNKIAANRAKKPQEDPIVKKQRLLEWWQKQYDNIDKNREKRQLWRVRNNRALEFVDAQFRREVYKRDKLADKRGGKLIASRRKERRAVSGKKK